MAHFGNHWFQEIFSSVTKYLLHKFIVIHSVSASPRARGGAAGPSPLPYIEIKKRNSCFVDWMIKKTFYVIYSSAEINHRNRLMVSTLEF